MRASYSREAMEAQRSVSVESCGGREGAALSDPHGGRVTAGVYICEGGVLAGRGHRGRETARPDDSRL